METNQEKRTQVSEYYSSLVGDEKPKLNTDCNCAAPTDPRIVSVMTNIHEEILEHYFGCASPIPPYYAMKGKTILDLGCGTGRDVYICSALVGNKGKVIGIDMTEKSLDIAKKYETYQMTQFGYGRSNVEFHLGTIEDLKKTASIEDNSIDFVLSNCVINLTPDKEVVMREIYRVLKPGGELYFSDMYCDRTVPQSIAGDSAGWGECLSGALSFNAFRDLMARVGFGDFRIMEQKETKITDEKLKEMAAGARWFSRTIRAFKIDGMDDVWQDYGQIATFLGEMDPTFAVDGDIKLYRGRQTHVDGNTALMLSESHYAPFITVTSRGKHEGRFDIGEYLLLEAQIQAELRVIAGAQRGGRCCGGPPAPAVGGGCCGGTPAPAVGGGCCGGTPAPAVGGGCCGGALAPAVGGGCCGGSGGCGGRELKHPCTGRKSDGRCCQEEELVENELD